MPSVARCRCRDLACSSAALRYRLSTDPADWIAYERACVRTELTRIALLLSSTVIPHAQRLPDDEWVQLVLGQLTGVKSALGLLVRSA